MKTVRFVSFVSASNAFVDHFYPALLLRDCSSLAAVYSATSPGRFERVALTRNLNKLCAR